MPNKRGRSVGWWVGHCTAVKRHDAVRSVSPSADTLLSDALADIIRRRLAYAVTSLMTTSIILQTIPKITKTGRQFYGATNCIKQRYCRSIFVVVMLSACRYNYFAQRERLRSIVMSISMSVCLCVCLSARISPKPHARSLPIFACCLWPWLRPPPASLLLAVRYVLPV